MTGGKVGRPKMMGRDAAVYLARWWRVNCLNASASEAEQWIVDHWRDSTPQGQKPGITDRAHVRAAIRRCGETWLKDASFSLTDGLGFALRSMPMTVLDPDRCIWRDVNSLPGDFSIDACSIAAMEFALHGRPRVMIWAPGLRTVINGHGLAIEDRLGEVPTLMGDRQGRTLIACAIAQSVGLFRKGSIERLHPPNGGWRFGAKS